MEINIDNIILNIKNVIQKFLLENGGLRNGYDTWVSWNFARNIHSPLTWKTPNKDITLREQEEKAGYLEKQITKICLDGGLFVEVGGHLSIKYQYIEDGCFDTIIEIVTNPVVRHLWH